MGLLLGLAYRAARLNLAGGGLGSPNWGFTLGVLVATAAFLAVVYYAWRRLHWPVLLVGGGVRGDVRLGDAAPGGAGAVLTGHRG